MSSEADSWFSDVEAEESTPTDILAGEYETSRSARLAEGVVIGSYEPEVSDADELPINNVESTGLALLDDGASWHSRIRAIVSMITDLSLGVIRTRLDKLEASVEANTGQELETMKATIAEQTANIETLRRENIALRESLATVTGAIRALQSGSAPIAPRPPGQIIEATGTSSSPGLTDDQWKDKMRSGTPRFQCILLGMNKDVRI